MNKFIITYDDFKINESLSNAKEKYGDEFTQQQFMILVLTDPTPTKKYIEHLCYWATMDALFKKTFYSQNGSPLVKNQLIQFEDYCKRNIITNKEIRLYKDYKEFVKVLDEASLKKSKTQQREELKEGASLIYEDDRYKIIKITTHDACMLYGKGTKWCITQEKPRYWQDYNKNSFFYFLFDNHYNITDKWYKVAIQFNYNRNSITLWDAIDQSHDLNDWLKITHGDKKVYDLIIQYANDIPLIDVSENIDAHAFMKLLGYEQRHYSANSDGSVSMDKGVILNFSRLNIKKIPIVFKNVEKLEINNCNNLVSFENLPRTVKSLEIKNCKSITSLEGSPIINPGEISYTNKNILTINNLFNLTSLKGLKFDLSNGYSSSSYSGLEVGIHINNTSITSIADTNLDQFDNINYNLNLENNKINTLRGIPPMLSFIDLAHNNIKTIDYFPKNYNKDTFSFAHTPLMDNPNEILRLVEEGFKFRLTFTGKSLPTFPKRYKGDIHIDSSDIISLDGLPTEELNGSLKISQDCKNLKNLIGCPKTINGEFSLTIDLNSKFESLEGSPQIVNDVYIQVYPFSDRTAKNTSMPVKLRDLTGGPRIVKNTMWITSAGLLTLKGAPQEVKILNVSRNNLTTLEGCPEQLSSLYAENNLITTLKYGPKKAENIHLSNNKLETLSDLKTRGITMLDVSENLITSVDINEDVGKSIKDLRLNKNKIKEFIKLPANLEILDISMNKSITSLVGLKTCPNLKTLYAERCNLSKIDYLPSNLKTIDFMYNNISKLAFMPEKVHTLNISHNRLSSLEGLPKFYIGGIKHKANDEVFSITDVRRYSKKINSFD